MSWSDNLTGVALNIAQSPRSPLRVMAGPGTGKSFAMKRRVARLIEEGQDPTRILAVTFTRNAAMALIDDLKELDVAGSEQIQAGTLHSHCFSLLNRESVFAFNGRTPRPLITFTTSGIFRFEGEALLSDIIGKPLGKKRDCTKRILAFEAAWARLQSDDPGWPNTPVDKEFQRRLLDWLKFHNAMLIGELVPEALHFLRNNPTSSELSAFDHVIVDEYQDLNKAEQSLIDLIASNGDNAIVGDADQSIYSFRHAHPEGIEQFTNDHPGTYDASLVECRRCPTKVVSIADHLIRHNHPSTGAARLRPMQGNPAGDIHIVQWRSQDEEIIGLTDYIQWLISAGGHEPGDVLVLVPRRYIGSEIKKILKERNISVHSFYHEETLKEKSAQCRFALLNLLANKEDRVSLRWWLGCNHHNWQRAEYARLKSHCEQSNESPWQALERLDTNNLQISSTKNILKIFKNLKKVLNKLDGLDLQKLVDTLFPAANDECVMLRESAITALPEVSTANELLEKIKAGITQSEVPEEGDFVRIMSLHKSKGLTSKVVIVAGAIHGFIPFHDSTKTSDEQEANFREQRRLFYVAITRAREILVISSAAQIERSLSHKLGAIIRRGYGSHGQTIASPFIAELGPSAPQTKRGDVWKGDDWI